MIAMESKADPKPDELLTIDRILSKLAEYSPNWPNPDQECAPKLAEYSPKSRPFHPSMASRTDTLHRVVAWPGRFSKESFPDREYSPKNSFLARNTLRRVVSWLSGGTNTTPMPIVVCFQTYRTLNYTSYSLLRRTLWEY